MTDGKMLKDAISSSGMKIVFIAEQMECSRTRLYAIINGGNCTASEIIKLTKILHLTKEQRDQIFLQETVN